MWLICKETPRGGNKLLIRGREGTEWVFCPRIKDIRRDRVSLEVCSRCGNFMRFQKVCGKTQNEKRLTRSLRLARPSVTSKKPRSRPSTVSTIPYIINERAPLIDVFDENDHMVIITEFPAIEKDDLRIKPGENNLTIYANGNGMKFKERINFSTPIEGETLELTNNNGVLVIKIKKGKIGQDLM